LEFKARLCGKGFRLIFSVDYHETYAPVACYNALRLFISILVSIDYEIDAIDVITAFLLAALEEEIYIRIPDGYKRKSKTSNAIRLLKASMD
jgi:Reverse transcriptase (RNA-dependent DNA polymerase)